MLRGDEDSGHEPRAAGDHGPGGRRSRFNEFSNGRKPGNARLMSETKNPGDHTLSVSPTKTLSLKRPVEAGIVRQSFSHGRSKAVVVEKVKRRVHRAGRAASCAREARRAGAGPRRRRAAAAAPRAQPAGAATAKAPAAPRAVDRRRPALP